MSKANWVVWIVLACASGNVLAAEPASAMSPMQHESMMTMNRMHEAMAQGMQEKDPDVAFTKGMLAHHQGAIEMANTELRYGKDPQMRALAENIIKAQQVEIQQMQAWLAAHPR